MSDPNFDRLYWVIGPDERGPARGPWLSQDLALADAQATGSYVVGLDVTFLNWSAVDAAAGGGK